MSRVVFVHGTGVREPIASETFGKVEQELRRLQAGLAVSRCYWGGSFGSELHGGLAVPDYDHRAAPGEGVQSLDADIELGEDAYLEPLWELLALDPLYEIRLMALRGGVGPRRELSPSEETAGTRVLADAAGVRPEREGEDLRQFFAALETAGIAKVFAVARDAVTRAQTCRDGLLFASDAEEAAIALSRAIIAEAFTRADGNAAAFDGGLEARASETLALQLAGVLVGQARAGVTEWIRRPLVGLAKRIGTRRVRRRRGLFTDEALGFPGDILVYQARGQAIRDAIRVEVERSDDSVVLLGHSLGGVACVDLLIQHALPRVARLITVGSQAPLFYEMNALPTLPFDAKVSAEQRLPTWFPDWVNFYDLNDFLSYIGGKLFGTRVTDVLVDNKTPFPESHSAYWDNPAFWKQVAGKLP